MNDAKASYFRVHAALDRILLFCAFVLFFHFFGVFAFLVPLVYLRVEFRDGRRLPKGMRRKLRAEWDLPRRVEIRRSRFDDCYVSGFLGFSTLFVTADAISDPSSESTKQRISHELGHHGRADHFTTFMPPVMAVFVALSSVYGLGLMVSGGIKPSEPLSATLLLAGYIISSVIYFWHLRRIYHYREYLADSYAMAIDPSGYRAFLDGRSRHEQFTEAKSALHRLHNDLLHPSHAKRLKFQREASHDDLAMRHVLSALALAVFTIAASGLGYFELLLLETWPLPFREGLNLFLALNSRFAPEIAWAVGGTLALLLLSLALRLRQYSMARAQAGGRS